MTEVGTGPAVLWLLPDNAAGVSPLAVRLAQDHRVVTLAASSTDARALAAVSPQLEQFVLIGQSSGAVEPFDPGMLAAEYGCAAP